MYIRFYAGIQNLQNGLDELDHRNSNVTEGEETKLSY